MKQHINYKIQIAILTLLLLASCQDYFIPEIDTKPTALVVQCILTNNEDYVKIMLNQSASYNDVAYYPAEHAAKVIIQSSDGQTYNTQETAPGVYYTIEKLKAERSTSYQLNITTQDGETYESSLETLAGTNEVESISTKVAEAISIRYDDNGVLITKKEKGIQLFVKPSPAEHIDMGFIYKWEALMTFIVHSERLGPSPININYYCWKYGKTDNFMTYNLVNPATIEDLPETKLNFMSYYYISSISVDTSRYARYITSVTISNVFYKLHQYTLPKKHIEFWENIEKQAQASGKLFDPVESQIIGNIKCTSDPKKLAFGYFQVAGYSHKTIKILLQALHYTGQKNVINIPVPPKDSIYYTNVIPEFW